MNIISLVLIISAFIISSASWPIIFGVIEPNPISLFFKDPLFISAMSTLVAAFAGAWGAQHIIEKEKNRGEIIKEIRAINDAIIRVKICLNSAILQKKMVAVIWRDYIFNRRSLINRKAIQIEARLQDLEPIYLDCKYLHEEISQRITSNKGILFNAFRAYLLEEKLNRNMVGYNKLVINLKGMDASTNEEIQKKIAEYMCFTFGNVEYSEFKTHLKAQYIDTKLLVGHLARLGVLLNKKRSALIKENTFYHDDEVSFLIEDYDEASLPRMKMFLEFEKLL